MKTIILTTKTVTIGLKAKKALLKNNIEAKLIKIERTDTSNGCQYGIKIKEGDLYNAIDTLREQKITYGVYNTQ